MTSTRPRQHWNERWAEMFALENVTAGYGDTDGPAGRVDRGAGR